MKSIKIQNLHYNSSKFYGHSFPQTIKFDLWNNQTTLNTLWRKIWLKSSIFFLTQFSNDWKPGAGIKCKFSSNENIRKMHYIDLVWQRNWHHQKISSFLRIELHAYHYKKTHHPHDRVSCYTNTHMHTHGKEMRKWTSACILYFQCACSCFIYSFFHRICLLKNFPTPCIDALMRSSSMHALWLTKKGR